MAQTTEKQADQKSILAELEKNGWHQVYMGLDCLEKGDHYYIMANGNSRKLVHADGRVREYSMN